jgi:Protein of unknown function (DUF3179)
VRRELDAQEEQHNLGTPAKWIARRGGHWTSRTLAVPRIHDMRRYKTGLFTALAILAIAIAAVFIPAYLIQPFKTQSKFSVQLSYYVRTYAPWVMAALFLLLMIVIIRHWKIANGAMRKTVLLIILFIVGLATWLACQNYYEWMFRPLPNPRFVRAEKATFLGQKDMVLTLAVHGDFAAYPVRLLAYHHLVHDSVGGKPIIATY